MRTLITLLLVLLCLLMPHPGFAAYLIELPDGATYLTNQYWEEDGRVRFSQYGGILTLSKNQIRKIKETDQECADPKQIE